MKPPLSGFSLLTFRGLLSLGTVLGVASLASAAPLEPFLREYCIKCHGPEKQKGDRRFDSLTATIKTPDEALLWLGLGMLGAQALPGFAVASREARQRA